MAISGLRVRTRSKHLWLLEKLIDHAREGSRYILLSLDKPYETAALRVGPRPWVRGPLADVFHHGFGDFANLAVQLHQSHPG